MAVFVLLGLTGLAFLFWSFSLFFHKDPAKSLALLPLLLLPALIFICISLANYRIIKTYHRLLTHGTLTKGYISAIRPMILKGFGENYFRVFINPEDSQESLMDYVGPFPDVHRLLDLRDQKAMVDIAVLPDEKICVLIDKTRLDRFD